MLKVVFVGDEPSRTNIDKSIPFVGAKCFDTFIEWVNKFDIDYYVVLNSHTKTDLTKIKKLSGEGFKVIAVGNKASDRLYKLDIRHAKMPHPSGLNRQLNDPYLSNLSIESCIQFLYEEDYV